MPAAKRIVFNTYGIKDPYRDHINLLLLNICAILGNLGFLPYREGKVANFILVFFVFLGVHCG